jgi:hypothetical protein
VDRGGGVPPPRPSGSHRSNAYDVLVNPDLGYESELSFDALADLPMVEQAAKVDGVVLIPQAG